MNISSADELALWTCLLMKAIIDHDVSFSFHFINLTILCCCLKFVLICECCNQKQGTKTTENRPELNL